MFFELMKKHKMIPATFTPEELAAAEKDFNETETKYIQTELSKHGVQQTPKTDDGKPADPAIAELKLLVGGLADTVKTLAENQTTLVKDVQTREKTAQAQAADAAKKRYTDSVQKAADEGRLTKAELDEALKDENVTRRTGNPDVLDTYLDGLSARAVHKGFVPPVKTGKPAPEAPGKDREIPKDPGERDAVLTNAAADAIDAALAL